MLLVNDLIEIRVCFGLFLRFYYVICELSPERAAVEAALNEDHIPKFVFRYEIVHL